MTGDLGLILLGLGIFKLIKVEEESAVTIFITSGIVVSCCIIVEISWSDMPLVLLLKKVGKDDGDDVVIHDDCQ